MARSPLLHLHQRDTSQFASWQEIGRRIVEFEQGGERRAEYGETLIKKLAVDFDTQFGRGFGAVNLSQMRKFFLTWPEEKIFQTRLKYQEPGVADQQP